MTAGMIALIPNEFKKFDFTDHEHPSIVQWKHDSALFLDDEKSTSYFYVTKGTIHVKTGNSSFDLNEGWFGSLVGKAVLEGSGNALVSTRKNYQGINQIGGPIEHKGRLQYINGCSSTLLLSAMKLGDPCFNFLHVPQNVDQTAHTHPTLRVGYVVSGNGIVKLDDGTIDLRPDLMFCLLPDALHSFHTANDELRIVIYHPDSDFGPSDEAHPMLNRTIVNGVSATELKRRKA